MCQVTTGNVRVIDVGDLQLSTVAGLKRVADLPDIRIVKIDTRHRVIRRRLGGFLNDLDDQEVMEDWQIPIMRAMAQHATETHGDVLEVGFGRGVSAEFIQECGVRSHTIVEANRAVVERFFNPWRASHSDRDIRLLEGMWQDVALELYDGVFFHAVPMDEADFVQHMVEGATFAEHFFPVAAQHLRPGGVFTYLSTEIDSLSRRHQRALLRHFESFSASLQELDVPADTRDAWWVNQMVIVKAVKA